MKQPDNIQISPDDVDRSLPINKSHAKNNNKKTGRPSGRQTDINQPPVVIKTSIGSSGLFETIEWDLICIFVRNSLFIFKGGLFSLEIYTNITFAYRYSVHLNLKYTIFDVYAPL